MHVRKSAIVALLVSGLLSPAVAQQGPSETEKQQFHKRMLELDAKYIQDFNKRDAAAIASYYTADAVSIGLAPQMNSAAGNAAIKKSFAALLKSTANYTDKITGWGMFSADTGWMGGPMSMTIDGKPAQGNWSWVMVRDGNDWKCEVENYALTPPPQSK